MHDNAEISCPNQWLAGHIWNWSNTTGSTAYFHLNMDGSSQANLAYLDLADGGGGIVQRWLPAATPSSISAH